jgi:lipopolysaccharide/colanic/teichoic acid biosynthesis glycosyltransferase
MKRAFDLTFVILGVFVWAPAILLIAALIRLRMGSPVMFVQARPGLHGRPFRMIKFRTMTDARAPNGEPLPDSARMTTLGRALRSTSLDELPEIWNVLKGEMSLVGPRPLLLEYLPIYNETQARRHAVKPGITGWAQINGRNAISWEERFALDIWYVDNYSVLLDLQILWRTFTKVCSREGISQPGEATMQKFRGSKSSN